MDNLQQRIKITPVIHRKIKYPNYILYEDGSVYSNASSRFLKPKTNNRGYLTLSLSKKRSKSITTSIHRLVAENFIDSNLSDTNSFKVNVNHIDGCKKNNHYKNLEIISAKENTHHYYASHLYKNSERSMKAETIEKMVNLFNSGKCTKKISSEIGIHYTSVRRILNQCSTTRLKPRQGKLFYDQLLEIHFLFGLCGYSHYEITKIMGLNNYQVPYSIIKSKLYANFKPTLSNLISYSQVRGNGSQAINDFIRSLKI